MERKARRSPNRGMKTVPTTTLDYVPGHRVVRLLGVFVGTSAKARAIGHDLFANLKAGTVGGDIDSYSELIEGATRQAMGKMAAQAAREGAHAVLGVKVATSMIAQGISEVTAYGTGVLLEPEEEDAEISAD